MTALTLARRAGERAARATLGAPNRDDWPVPELDPTIREYYERGGESGRLGGGFPSGPLELERTKELILRHLLGAPLDVLDVGGGPGVYAEWLAGEGHRVRLVDPVPLHVRQARERSSAIEAVLGDARQLGEDDATADVVLLLGPLYHLTSRSDRDRTLREARRVLRPGGLLFAAGISRYAALLDLLLRLDRFHEPDIARRARSAVETGTFEGHAEGLFTTAYFHLPDQLRAEVGEAGFVEITLFNVEGPALMVPDFAERWSDPARREAMLLAARLVETEPTTMGAASHLLVVARR